MGEKNWLKKEEICFWSLVSVMTGSEHTLRELQKSPCFFPSISWATRSPVPGSSQSELRVETRANWGPLSQPTLPPLLPPPGGSSLHPMALSQHWVPGVGTSGCGLLLSAFWVVSKLLHFPLSRALSSKRDRPGYTDTTQAEGRPGRGGPGGEGRGLTHGHPSRERQGVTDKGCSQCLCSWSQRRGLDCRPERPGPAAGSAPGTSISVCPSVHSASVF